MAMHGGYALESVPGGGPRERRLTLDGGAIPLRLVLVGAERVSEAWQNAEIQTSFWRFYQADAAGVSLSWAGGTMDYPVTGVICVPGWIRFRFHWRRRVLHRYIHAEPTAWPRTLVQSHFPAPFLIPDRSLGDDLRALTTCMSDPDAWAPELALTAQAIACRGLALALAKLPRDQRPRLQPADGNRFASVLAHIEAALDRALGVPVLAVIAGMQPQPFIRAFRRAYGTTPMQFIIERRIARACRLLIDSGMGIDAVASACGFPNRQYLTRMFSRAMGISPAKYRQRPAGDVLAR